VDVVVDILLVTFDIFDVDDVTVEGDILWQFCRVGDLVVRAAFFVKLVHVLLSSPLTLVQAR